MNSTLADSPTGHDSPATDHDSADMPALDSPDAVALESAAATYLVAYLAEPSPIPLNEPFDLEVVVRQPGGETVGDEAKLTVDGRMPHHRHGMNRRPLITRMGPGRFRVEGMLFHMPGRWELHFDVTRGGVTERAQDNVHLE